MEADRMMVAWGIPVAGWVAALLPLVAAGVVVVWWRGRGQGLDRRRWRLLMALRAATAALLATMLLDPKLVIRRTEPADDYVVVLFDDSRSMKIVGNDGVSRAERLRRAYETARPAFEDALRARHRLAMYRFGASASRIGGFQDLRFELPESDPLAALVQVRRDLAGAPIAAIVLLTDGVRQAAAPALDVDQAVEPATPVYVVGVDEDAAWRDLELASLTVSRSQFDKSPVTAVAQVRATGLRGRQAAVEIVHGGRVVAAKPLVIDTDRLESRVPLEFIPQEEGWLAYEARVRLIDNVPGAPDLVPQNDARPFVVDNRKRTFRILFLAGRPTWQNKFIRRALDADPSMDLTSLVRISSPDRTLSRMQFRGGSVLGNQLFEGFDETEVHAPRWDEAVFLRTGRTGSGIVTEGYPHQPETLFAYDLIIWGGIEADFFSRTQLDLTRDFVDKRGGSLLLLGGPDSFTEGGFADSLIEPMLPVMLRAARDREPLDPAAPFRARPTIDGFLSGVWVLDPDPNRNREAWLALPELFGYHRFPMVRPGATVHARVEADSLDAGGPLFAVQAYGQGRCAVLAAAETWTWQTMAPASDDSAHERFWRQLVRSLVVDVPRPAVWLDPGDRIESQPSRLRFLVRDASFERRESLRTSIRIHVPSGASIDVPADESIREAGVYEAEFTPQATGLHRIDLTALDADGRPVAELEQAMMVQPDLREFQNAAFDPALSEAIARRSGGERLGLDALASLAARIPTRTARRETTDVYPLWRFPGFFGVLALLWSTEWYLRRRAGQP